MSGAIGGGLGLEGSVTGTSGGAGVGAGVGVGVGVGSGVGLRIDTSQAGRRENIDRVLQQNDELLSTWTRLQQLKPPRENNALFQQWYTKSMQYRQAIGLSLQKMAMMAEEQIHAARMPSTTRSPVGVASTSQQYVPNQINPTMSYGNSMYPTQPNDLMAQVQLQMQMQAQAQMQAQMQQQMMNQMQNNMNINYNVGLSPDQVSMQSSTQGMYGNNFTNPSTSQNQLMQPSLDDITSDLLFGDDLDL